MADTMQSIKLIDLVPPNLQSDPQVQAAAAALDSELRSATEAINEALLLPRLDELPEAVVDLLAWQWHVDFYDPALSLTKKRNLVRQAIAWHKRKGTPSAVQDMVSSVFSGGKVYEWFEYGGEPYHFRVETTGVIGGDAIYTQLSRVINAVKNVRSWLDGIYIQREWSEARYYGGIVRTGKSFSIYPATFPAQTAINNQYVRGAIHKGVIFTIGAEVQ
jgi:phage tail P2-like protein